MNAKIKKYRYLALLLLSGALLVTFTFVPFSTLSFAAFSLDSLKYLYFAAIVFGQAFIGPGFSLLFPSFGGSGTPGPAGPAGPAGSAGANGPQGPIGASTVTQAIYTDSSGIKLWNKYTGAVTSQSTIDGAIAQAITNISGVSPTGAAIFIGSNTSNTAWAITSQHILPANTSLIFESGVEYTVNVTSGTLYAEFTEYPAFVLSIGASLIGASCASTTGAAVALNGANASIQSSTFQNHVQFVGLSTNYLGYSVTSSYFTGGGAIQISGPSTGSLRYSNINIVSNNFVESSASIYTAIGTETPSTIGYQSFNFSGNTVSVAANTTGINMLNLLNGSAGSVGYTIASNAFTNDEGTTATVTFINFQQPTNTT
ncbi:MAG: hypothetical protein ACYDG3_12120, partial [Bacillati bacterium]